MANIVETGIRYAGSVVARSVGVEGFRRGVLPQIIMPIFEPYNFRIGRRGATETEAMILTGRVVTDFLLMAPAVILLGHGHPTEAILAKLAANAVSHVGLDVFGAGARGMQRLLRNLRPSPGTLAV